MDSDPSLNSIFKTTHFRARKLTFADLEDFHRLQSNPFVMRYATGKPQDLEENRADLANVISNYTAPHPDLWVYGIELLENGLFIGTAGFSKMKDGEPEVGIRLLEEHWSKGYGKEIMKALIEFGFNYFESPVLYAAVDYRNVASIKVLEQCGFQFQETRYNSFYQADEHIYRVTKL